MSVALGACLILSDSAEAQSDSLDRAVSLHRAGKLSEALAAYQEVVTGSADPSRLSLAYQNSCHVLISLAEPEMALEQCGKALELRRGLGDERGVARTLSNLGLALRHLGRYHDAEAAYRESLAINERRGDTPAQVRIRSNLGLVLTSAGRYSEAMAFLTTAQSLAEQHADEPWAPRQIRVTRLNQGVVLEKLGAYREALALYQELAGQVGEEDFEFLARLRVNLGVIYRNLGDPMRAVEFFEKAAQTWARLGATAELSNTQLNLALALHLNLGQLEEAERAYLEALELAREGRDYTEKIQDLFYLGNLYLDLERFDEAESSFRQCLELSQGNGFTEGSWSGLYGLGRVAEARGQARMALELFRTAIEEVEQLRASLAEATWRSGFFGDKRPIYAAAVRVLASLHGEEPGGGHSHEALAIVQRAKARELLEYLGGDRPPGSPQNAETLRGLLREGEVLFEYFQGEEDLFLWILRADGIRMIDLGAALPILDRVERVHEALAAGEDPSGEDVIVLSRVLLGGDPLEGVNVLRIAPDGRLSHLPFEILPDPDGSGGLLLDRLVITYLPSASTLALLDQRVRVTAQSQPRPELWLTGFANPELSLDSEEPRIPLSLLASRFGFGPLPAAEREIETVGRILKGRNEIRKGAAATEEAFRALAAEPSRVLHLATHTLVDDRPGQRAVILLAADGRYDGLVYPEEIVSLDYRAQLTVLASCRSALGEKQGGQALISLTDAFLAAGSSGVVATLWEVGDSATATFMEQFYHQLSRGLSADEALRQAKLHLRAAPTWNRPAIWSAYVLVGEGVKVVEPPRWIERARLAVPAWSWILAVLLFAIGIRNAVNRRSGARRRTTPS